MRILAIMLYWYPYEGPLMPIYSAIFEDLVAKGHSVTLISSFPHYRKGHEKSFKEYRGKIFEVSTYKSIRLLRCYVYAPEFKTDKYSLVMRALNFLSFSLSSILAGIVSKGKYDIILAPSSPPISNGISAWLISLFKRCPVVYNVQDLYPDMAIKLGLIKNPHVLAFLKMAENLVYRLSTTVVTISQGMRKVMLQKGVLPKKIQLIENFIDTDFIRPSKQDNHFSRLYGLENLFVVLYAGNIGIPHGVEVIIHAAEILNTERKIVFCFVGRGENREKIIKLARERRLPNTVFIDHQPEEMVPLIWATASVAVITYRRGLADFSIPSKLLAMMCAGRPVIISADAGSDAAELVRRAKCGICVSPESPQALADAIIELKTDPKTREMFGLNGRSYAEENLQRKVISDQYESLFRSLSKADAVISAQSGEQSLPKG